MRSPLTVAVAVLCSLGYFRPVFCQAKRIPPILGPSITSTILKKYNVKVQSKSKPEEQIILLRRQAMDSYSDCDDNATEFNVDDILNENAVKEKTKRGPSIPGPPITSTILNKHNVKPQPIQDSMKQNASTHPQATETKGFGAGELAPGSDVDTTNDKGVQKKKVKHRPAIPGPQITSIILKKHKLDGSKVPGANTNDKSQKEKDQIHNECDKDGEQNRDKQKGDNLDEAELLKDMHTHVVLLEITFANNERKYRTGTVIHEHVVITAAHSFEDYTTRNNNVEISLSFVIIGTKHAFDRGSQHYLPIEKLVIHPEHKGWNADLALVFTYARIVTDNYGLPIPIEGYEPSIPDTSILMVASWGKCNCNKPPDIPEDKYLYRSNQKVNSQKQSRADIQSIEARSNFRPILDKGSSEDNNKIQTRDSILETSDNDDDGEILDNNANMELNRRKSNILEQQIERKYIPDIMDKPKRYLNHKKNKTDIDEFITKLSKTEVDVIKTDDSFVNATELFKYYKNKLFSESKTRRKMTQALKNRLVVGEFHLVNEKSCKDLLAQIMPLKHKILNPIQFLCYSSLDKYLTRSDAGAAVTQDGNLVAVTAGGVEADGKHFGVGLKMSCFCTWIAQQLPDGGEKLDCSKDCCGNRNRSSLRRGMQKNIKRTRRRGSRMQFNFRFLPYGDSSGEV